MLPSFERPVLSALRENQNCLPFKVKGIISTKDLTVDDFVDGFNETTIEPYQRIWDISDIVIPPSVSIRDTCG